MNTAVAELPQQPQPVRVSLIARLASRFHVDPDKMMQTLKQTAFRQKGNDPEPTNEQMMALCVVADQYGLNPWTKEIYAFPDKYNGIVPVVGLDGWSRIVNNHPHYDGVEFAYGPASQKHKGAPEWIDCSIWRKDRTHATVVREILAECYRDTGPWNSHPSRMLRHKAFMQAGRLAFSFVGIYDEDEAQRILEGESSRVSDTAPAIEAINAEVTGKVLEHKPAEKVPPVTVEGEKVAVATKPAAEETKAAAADANKSKGEPITLPAATVRERIDAALAAKSRDLLDQAAAEISLVVGLPQQKELTERYKAHVAVLESDDGK